jgi:hypothetical protein
MGTNGRGSCEDGNGHTGSINWGGGLSRRTWLYEVNNLTGVLYRTTRRRLLEDSNQFTCRCVNLVSRGLVQSLPRAPYTTYPLHDPWIDLSNYV